jgi:hypothetical protein
MTESRLPKQFTTEDLQKLIDFDAQSNEVEINDALVNLIDALDYLHLENFKANDRKEVIKLVLEAILILDESQNQLTKAEFKDVTETEEGEEITIKRGELVLEHITKE